MKHIVKFKQYEKLNEMVCPSISNPLASEVEFEECCSAMTFDDVMKPFIKKLKQTSIEIGQAYSLYSFLSRWEDEYVDYKNRLKD